MYGEGTPLATRWAKRRLAELWAGQVPKVLAALRRHQQRGPAVEDALTSYTNQQHRNALRGVPRAGTPSRQRHDGERLQANHHRAAQAGRNDLVAARHEALALRPRPQRAYQRRVA